MILPLQHVGTLMYLYRYCRLFSMDLCVGPETSPPLHRAMPQASCKEINIYIPVITGIELSILIGI